MSLPVPSQTNPQTYPFYENWFVQNYGANAGKAYYNLAAQAPNATPTQIAEALATEITGRGLARAIGDVTSGTLAATSLAANTGFGITPSGLGLGFGGPGTLPADVNKGLTGAAATAGSDWQHLMIRFAEFAIGAILIIVGLNAVLARTKAGQGVQKIAVEAVGMTPPARAVRTEIGARREVAKTAQSSAIVRRSSRLRNDRLSRQS